MRELLLRLTPYSPPGARGWYRGGVFGSIYVFVGIWEAWTSRIPLGVGIAVTVLLLVIGLLFVLLPPALWGRPRRVVYPALLAFALLICVLFPLIGVWTVWILIYVSCAAAAALATPVEAVAAMLVVALAQLVTLLVADALVADGFVILLTFSIGAMVLGIASTSRANFRLRQAQGEVARLAVAEERARFSRDLHDVLGHTLTVVTVKSELATRLLDRDVERTRAELADIERLTRSALADLRASIAGYRQMSLDTELAAARAALAAAEIDAVVPVSGDVVEPGSRELFAWAVREAVTNVVRHARATRCAIELTPASVRICDDGVGISVGTSTGPGAVSGGTDAASGIRSGSGLAGLAERAAAAGATLRVEAAESRGTVVSVSRPSPAVRS